MSYQLEFSTLIQITLDEIGLLVPMTLAGITRGRFDCSNPF